jgi:serine-type D-Ala-D-Ala carboxypeptidase/endopeptidase (penicillin-binding protein 4)
VIRQILLVLSVIWSGCGTQKVIVPPLPPPLVAPAVVAQSTTAAATRLTTTYIDTINAMIDTSSILSSGWTGLVVWDLGGDSLIMDRSASKMFTSASNTKMLTLYSCLHTLGDSIPGLKYIETDTSLVFWGTGDPSFLNRKFPHSKTFAFLQKKSTQKRLYYWPQQVDAAYGEGWMWDDYNGGYQPEISAFPMYENMTHFAFEKSAGWKQNPKIGAIQKKQTRDYNIQRQLYSNTFDLSTAIDSLFYYQQSIPIFDVVSQIIKMLSDTLHTQVRPYSKTPNRKLAKTFYSIPTDTILSEMMAQSDNFLAEHMLIVCANTLGDSMSTRWMIDTLQSGLMANLSPTAKWVDGSGLSRYNLSSPMLNMRLAKLLYHKYGEKRVFNLMAIGGQKGTLKSLYSDQASPYVFAKTGTLSGVYNLSGYLITKTGKRFCFSMMNNHFASAPSKARQETQRIMKYIYQRW